MLTTLFHFVSFTNFIGRRAAARACTSAPCVTAITHTQSLQREATSTGHDADNMNCVKRVIEISRNTQRRNV
jgi:hypothetical protein